MKEELTIRTPSSRLRSTAHLVVFRPSDYCQNSYPQSTIGFLCSISTSCASCRKARNSHQAPSSTFRSSAMSLAHSQSTFAAPRFWSGGFDVARADVVLLNRPPQSCSYDVHAIDTFEPKCLLTSIHW